MCVSTLLVRMLAALQIEPSAKRAQRQGSQPFERMALPLAVGPNGSSIPHSTTVCALQSSHRQLRTCFAHPESFGGALLAAGEAVPIRHEFSA